jgi:hypothetical protein
MDNRYSVFVHLELMGALPKRGLARQRVVDFIRSLADDPFKSGDFTDQDSSLRTRQIKIVGQFAITYWADHPAKKVMIVDFRSADK